MNLLIPLALLLTVVAVIFVLQPVVAGRTARLVGGEDESEAEARKRVALRALRDVEYDYATGKLDDEDYSRLKSELAQEALEAIDAEKGDGARAVGSDGSDGGGVDVLEEEIARYRESLRSGKRCPECGAGNELAARFCASCGTRLAARFCSSCGAPRTGDEDACEACGAPLG